MTSSPEDTVTDINRRKSVINERVKYVATFAGAGATALFAGIIISFLSGGEDLTVEDHLAWFGVGIFLYGYGYYILEKIR
jgi:hypothetical protein